MTEEVKPSEGVSVPGVATTDLDVQPQLVGVVEDGLALVTAVNAAPAVRGHVVPQVVTLGEGRAALLAHEGLVALVRPHVALEVAGLHEGLVALLTHKRPVRLPSGRESFVY